MRLTGLLVVSRMEFNSTASLPCGYHDVRQNQKKVGGRGTLLKVKCELTTPTVRGAAEDDDWDWPERR